MYAHNHILIMLYNLNYEIIFYNCQNIKLSQFVASDSDRFQVVCSILKRVLPTCK